MKLRTYILLFGILLIVGSMPLQLIYGGNEDLMQSPIDVFMKGMSLPIIILMICVLAPITEELAFRYWAAGSKRAKIVSVVGVFFMTGMVFGYVISIPATIIFAVMSFLMKNKNAQLISLTVFTSVLFGMLHIDNYNNNNFLFPVIYCTGLGLIAVYCVLRWNIWVAIAFHCVNNLLVLVLSQQMLLGKTDTEIITSDNFDMEISRVQNWSLMPPITSYEMTDSSMTMKNTTMTGIIRELSVKDTGYLFVDNTDNRLYDLKLNVFNRANVDQMRGALIERFDIKFDTIDAMKDYLYLSFSDDVLKGTVYPDRTIYVSPPIIISNLSRNCKKNVVCKTEALMVPMRWEDFQVLNGGKDFEKVKKALEANGAYLGELVDGKFILVTSIDQ